jgi:hypothetical protein
LPKKADPRIKEYVFALYASGKAREPAEADVLLTEAVGDLVPEAGMLRTIQRWYAQWRAADTSAAWILGSTGADGIDERLALKTLASLVDQTEGLFRRVTVLEAKWVTVLARAVPELDVWDLFLLARAFITSQSEKNALEDLQMLLARAPWCSVESEERYWKTLPPAPLESAGYCIAITMGHSGPGWRGFLTGGGTLRSMFADAMSAVRQRLQPGRAS